MGLVESRPTISASLPAERGMSVEKRRASSTWVRGMESAVSSGVGEEVSDARSGDVGAGSASVRIVSETGFSGVSVMGSNVAGGGGNVQREGHDVARLFEPHHQEPRGVVGGFVVGRAGFLWGGLAEVFSAGAGFFAVAHGGDGFLGVACGEAVAAAEFAAVEEDFFEDIEAPYRGRVVADGVFEHGPGDFGGDDGIARRGEAKVFSGGEGAGEEVDHDVEFFVVEGGGFVDGLIDAVDFDGGVFEIVGHAGDALGADAVDVAVVGFVLGEVAVDEALGDVEDDAIFEGAV